MQGIKETNENILDLIPNEETDANEHNSEDDVKRQLWVVLDQSQGNDNAPYSAPVLPRRSVSDAANLNHSASNII